MGYAASASGLMFNNRTFDEHLVWFKVAKAASTALKHRLLQAVKSQDACKGLQVSPNHMITAANLITGQRAFAVLREPCDRFMSQWAMLSERFLATRHSPQEFCEDVYGAEMKEIQD